MIARLIAWSARNLLLVLFGAGFAAAAGIYALVHLPLDAIPDLSDTQVIVYTEYPGQAPQVIEDQVTYPLATAMLTVPRSRVVRGFSYFGVSFVYVIFEDGTDIYWARSRVLEYLNAAMRRLPGGVTPTLGPDATGVGWVYQYALLAKDRSLAELRSLQDWYVRYGLAKAEGVAEIASVGGFVKQYNVVIDPQRLRSFDIPLSKVRDAIRASNMDVGGRTVELSEFEYVVRGRGYLKGIRDLQTIVLKNDGGTPVLIQDVARVELGPDERRGLTELNGEGEVASGIVLQRFGANALDVIDNVKKRIAEIAGSLPKGVEIEAVITALFCDLRGFTGFSESSDPEDVMALLRDYHAAIGEIIIKYSGTLERYAGEGVMVVFNDPVPVDNPALQAVLMALEMRDAIGSMTDKWRRMGHDIGFGIGIAHGFATLGTIGFEGRFDYAAIGTVSNVASRLCDEAKPGQILISPRVLMAVEDAVKVEPVGEFALKGIRRPLAAYNVVASQSSEK